jgi:hypothetical protein
MALNLATFNCAPFNCAARILIFSVCGLLSIGASVKSTQAQPAHSATLVPTVDDESSGRTDIRKSRFKAPTSNSVQRFIDLDPNETGVDLMHIWNPPKLHRSLNFGVYGHGVAIGDFDNDGLPDVFVSRQTDAGRLYRNLGGMKFEDVTSKVGIDPEGMWATGTTFVDINNDGWLDLFLCGYHCPCRLYINEQGRYSERAEEYGLNFDGSSVVMLFADYDRDGDVDGYLVTNYLKSDKPLGQLKVIREPGRPPVVAPEQRERIYLQSHPSGRYRQARAGQYDHLYRNDGQRFVDVTEESGIGLQPWIGLSACWWDYDGNGWPDLYVGNDFRGPDFLYRNNGPNENGTVTFTDVIQVAVPHTPWFSMGSDFADVDNDGRLDYLATDMAGTSHYRDKLSMGQMSGEDSMLWFLNWPNPPQYMRNTLYLNSGTDRFLEVAFLTGLAKSDWTWTAKFADFDNDGWQDVYFTNGMTRDIFNGDLTAKAKVVVAAATKSGNRAIRPGEVELAFWEQQEPFRSENLAFRNQGDLKFTNVSTQWGLDHFGVNTGGAVGDLDNDGDLDLVITGFEERVRVYRNDVAAQRSLRVNLIGNESNRYGLGALVTVTITGDQKLVQYSSPTRGFMSTSEPTVHFGVGDASIVEQLVVEWPSGVRQVFANLETNATYAIVEDKTKHVSAETIEAAPLFASSEILSDVEHRETAFDDFERQPLLPHKHSQLGPGMAWGDIDGDGDDDLFVGGAAGSEGILVENQGPDIFVKKSLACFREDANCEDMGALFFDTDRDEDLDLYVVSGGVECEPGADRLQDRLYLNDGRGDFTRSDLLPDLKFSGGCVTANDFDRDGDLDLFVGGRVVPGAYPEPPRSALLENTSKGLRDCTADAAPELSNPGMITSAIWSDVDGDDWPDLLTTQEWGPVRLFRNLSGKLTEQTNDSGLAQRTGWFNSICGGDIDNDGDTDFVVGNFGLNTKYKASPEHPAIIYYADFDGSGRKQIVEAKFEKDICYPVRGLSCSSDAMPLIKQKLPTFHQFAIAELTEIYGNDKLADALKVEATDLQSGVLINQSSAANIQFEFRPLPRIAQASPIYGSVLTDVNLDGMLDLYVVHNFFGPQRETGYMDGGLSQLLFGDGQGNFRAVSPRVSGLVVSGDAKSLAIADLNRDGKVDFVIGKNDASMQTFLNRSPLVSRGVSIQSKAGKNQVVGAKVKIRSSGGQTRLHEVTCGSGYLSQSPNVVFGAIEIDAISWPSVPTNSDSNSRPN